MAVRKGDHGMDEQELADMKARPVAEQAAAWLLAFDQGELTGDARQAFVAWVKESPNHIEEFLQVSSLDLMLVESPEKVGELDALVAEVRGNVVDLADARQAIEPAAPAVGSRGLRPFWVAATAAVVVAGVALYVLWQPAGSPYQTYQTSFGEQRSVVLQDDSLVVLNTESKLTIVYTDTGRHAILHTGEALFEVSRDPSRPFTVDAGPAAIRVLGTTFNVYRLAEQTVVTVVEGEVTVAAGDGHEEGQRQLPATTSTDLPGSGRTPRLPTDALQLTAGQQVAVASSGAVDRQRPADLEQATAWTERRLVFDREPLSKVFEEFNRYNRRRLVLDVPALAEREITGVFDARDVETLLGFVEAQPGVRVLRGSDEIRIVPVQ